MRFAGPSTTRRSILGASAVALAAPLVELFATPAMALTVTSAEAKAIAKEAYIYAFPIILNYKTMYAYAIDKSSPEYKAPFNQITNVPRVFTPDDRAIITPNSDTPYSFIWADLRAEPIVISVSTIDPKRYYSFQFIDLYTYNFAYIGTATTGNNAGSYLLAGPDWHGEKPARVTKIIRCETEFAFPAARTQLFGPQDLDAMKAVQAGYKVQTLSQFLDKPAPPPAPTPSWPVWDQQKAFGINFISYLNFLQQFCPTHPSEKALMVHFSKIGIAPGREFDPDKLDPANRAAIEQGAREGQAEIDRGVKNITTASAYLGSRAFLKNDFLKRAIGAQAGIYGNSASEAVYLPYLKGADGAPLDASKVRYSLHFAKNDMPPARAFWSLTMYDGKTQLLVANPLNRYLINSPMLPNLTRDADGGLTIYIQKETPGADKESNWLPAPDGPFYMWLRIYWPEQIAIEGKWKQPLLKVVS